MKNKVLLISIDGMRPDGLLQCGNPYVSELEKICAYTYSGSSVFPSVTLPCHFSMTHSVPPTRHGILTNTYVPQVRPVKGIFERIKEEKGKAAIFYGWEELRDIALPGTCKYATYVNALAVENGDNILADECEKIIDTYKPDFAFLYMVETDEKGGHGNGWMSEAYKACIANAINNVKRMIEKYGNEYRVIIMADHGGHDRMHGTEMPEDMTVPFFFYGPEFTPGEIKKPVSLLEIAPTIAALLGIAPDEDWEGYSLV